MNKKIIVAIAAVLVIAGYFAFANVSEASTLSWVELSTQRLLLLTK